jgi:hypothetical protein
MVKIGADPEFFIRRGIHYISGHLIPLGTKQRPTKTENGAVQNDGLAVECNVNPADTREGFIANVQAAMADLTFYVKQSDPLYELVAKPSVFFGNKFISKLPRMAKELGCSPDFDAWEMAENPRPNGFLPFRTGSGHVHIGWTDTKINPRDPEHMMKCFGLARELDYTLGLMSLGWDTDSRRRLLYGRAGAFRPKPYGMEYRTLSNTWLNNTFLMGKVFDGAVKAYENFESDNSFALRYGSFAQEAINTNMTDWYDVAPEIADELGVYNV